MKKVLAIFLTLLMLTTNVSISLATHYCGGKAVKTSVGFAGSELPGCGMEKGEKGNCENAPVSLTKKCCETQVQILNVEDDYNKTAVVKTAVDFQFVAAFIVSYINLYSFNASTEAEYLNYSPPLLALDIPVLIQSFLI